MSANRSKPILAVVLVAGLAAIAWAAVRFGPEIRVTARVRRFEAASPEERPARLEKLAALGARGERAIEAIAFSPDEPRELRQLALDHLHAKDKEAKKPVEPARLARYMSEAVGLERGWVASDLGAAPTDDPALVEACLTSLARDDSSEWWLHFTTWSYLKRGEPLDRTLERVVLRAPDRTIRLEACGILAERRCRDVLVKVLADGDWEIRVRAARALACQLHDTAALPVLLEAPKRRSWGQGRDSLEVLESFAALHERGAVAILVRSERDFFMFHERWSSTLAEITSHSLTSGETWGQWLEAHRGELPPQLEARAGKTR